MECNILRGHSWIEYSDSYGSGRQCSRCGLTVYDSGIVNTR